MAPAPADLLDRRVEITGPTERKMTINALNSGAQGLARRPGGRQHAALGERGRRPGQPVRRRSAATSRSRSATGKSYALRDDGRTADDRDAPARLAPRRAAPAGRRRAGASARSSTSACYFFHNAAELLERGSGPYFYLPKMESHLEARLWNDVFTYAQERARHPARHDPGHRADRDHPGRVRDGRDPLRAARARLRAERRPLGLPVQHHQVLPRRRARLRAAGPQRGRR